LRVSAGGGEGGVEHGGAGGGCRDGRVRAGEAGVMR
jgi:hypothetical protein